MESIARASSKALSLTLTSSFRAAFAFLAFSAATLATSPVAEAKDLHGRFGVGYNGQFSNREATRGVPGVSIKYGLTRDLGASLVFGINTASPVNSVTALKFFQNIFAETNMNFYFTLGGGILSTADSTGLVSATSTEFLTALGAEFFIPGLESLGFTIESGVKFTNVTGTFALKTMGLSFIDAGVHFYF